MVQVKGKDKNYEFYINADLSEYAGKWIAIVDGKVVASGDRADEIYEEARKRYPGKRIAIDKVPTDDVLVL